MPRDQQLGEVRRGRTDAALGFDDATFDAVYAYSVFSHLSEVSHLAWIEEIARVLKPGGMLVATTLPRMVLKRIAEVPRDQVQSAPAWARGLVDCFPRPDDALAAYDRGDYCFGTTGMNEHYGNAVVSEAYVRARWTEYFQVLDYVRPRSMPQTFIVCRRAAAGTRAATSANPDAALALSG